MIIDKLYGEIKEKNGICLGLDTHLDYIPQYFKEKYCNLSELVFAFNKCIIDNSKDLVAIYKLQIAYYEAMGLEGLKAYAATMKYLRKNNILSIGDIKRSDIASTATQYAKAHLEPGAEFEADFITLNPYMGMDSITPYLDYVQNYEKGLFVLVRTSNPGCYDIEGLVCEDGSLVYEKVADKLANLAQSYMGSCNYSAVGMVMGGTHGENNALIREKYINIPFLIPGYGAQGADIDFVKNFVGKDGMGGVVNSSRGLIFSSRRTDINEEEFITSIRTACCKMRADIYER